MLEPTPPVSAEQADVAVLVALDPYPAAPVYSRLVGGRSLLDRAIDTAETYARRVAVVGTVATDRCAWEPADAGESLSQPLARLLVGEDESAVVLLHDLRWATVAEAVWGRVLGAAGPIPVVPDVEVTDTVRSRDGKLADRAELRQCQSPRAYRRHDLESLGPSEGDDLAALAERGGPVVRVEGDRAAHPVVHPRDLRVASARITA